MRWLRLVSAQPVLGIQKNSKWSFSTIVLVELLEDLVDAHRHLDGAQVEGVNALQGNGRDDAEGAEADARRLEDVGVLLRGAIDDRTVAGDQPQACDLRREASKLPAGTVRRGRSGAGDALVGNVPEIGHREAERIELFVQLGERNSCLHRDLFSGEVDVGDLVVAVELE